LLQDTWRLVKERGIDAIINDNLVGNVLSTGAIVIGLFCGMVGLAFVRAMPLTVARTSEHLSAMYGLAFFIAFLIGTILSVVISEVIESGTATTFVCLAEDPDALRHNQPQLWEKIRATYPEVAQNCSF
jgi:hypothetical protein